jgi:hypothetical protein
MSQQRLSKVDVPLYTQQPQSEYVSFPQLPEEDLKEGVEDEVKELVEISPPREPESKSHSRPSFPMWITNALCMASSDWEYAEAALTACTDDKGFFLRFLRKT